MSNVHTKTITDVRQDISADVERAGITRITKNGKFVGVLITTGDVSDPVAEQFGKVLKHNPTHGVSVLTKQAISE